MSLEFLALLFLGVFVCGIRVGIAWTRHQISTARRREDEFFENRKSRVLRRV